MRIVERCPRDLREKCEGYGRLEGGESDAGGRNRTEKVLRVIDEVTLSLTPILIFM